LPVELDDRQPPRAQGGPLARIVEWANRATLVVGMTALVAASFILTYSVVSRYLFKAATDWQDEAAVFCIVGTVSSAALVQAGRGHIGIEAISSLLSPAVNRIRQIWSMCSRCCSAPFSPGSRGRCGTKRGSTR
jgi:TRAP-type C4-dicarboxylate transport system permease small subunit